MSGKGPKVVPLEKWEEEEIMESGHRTELLVEPQSRQQAGNGSMEDLNFLIKPFAHINETKDVLQKLGTVHIVKGQMQFSDREFEQRYIDSLEPKLRSRMLLFAVATIGYGLYSMFLHNTFGPECNTAGAGATNKREPLLYKWKYGANRLYNAGCMIVVTIGFVILLVSWKKNMFRHRLEQFLQYLIAVLLAVAIMFVNLWRVSKLTGDPFELAFEGITDLYPDADLVMLLGSIILYLAVVAYMRLRRLVWICLLTWLFYGFTVLYFKLPDFSELRDAKCAPVVNPSAVPPPPHVAAGRQLLVLQNNVVNVGLSLDNTYDSSLRDVIDGFPTLGAPGPPAARASLAPSAARAAQPVPAPSSSSSPPVAPKVKESKDTMQNWLLALQLLTLYAIAMFGKVQLELLQRQNFLELELAQKRIDVLEKTINAMDTNNQPHSQLEQAHKRLKDAERIIEKVKLMGMTTGEQAPSALLLQELGTVLDVLKETERSMTILDFQKEVLLGPIKTGVEYKEEEVMNWIQSAMDHAPGRSAEDLRQPSSTTLQPFWSEMDLGISAKSLMKRIGVEWNLDPAELEQTLKNNGSSDMDALCMTTSALLQPFLNNVLLGITPDILTGFARALSNAYLDVPFHNADHAAMVGHHATVLLDWTGVRKHLGGLDRLATVVAALGHNVSHFGRSNAFLSETRHELALRYNDTSVLENFHASKTFEIIRASKQTNITATLSRRDEKRFRNRVVQLILATDQGQHFAHVSELRMRLMGGSMFEDSELLEVDKRVGMVSVVNSAVYGHCAMPLDVHSQWIERLFNEYARQGDDERALGNPVSPMCDRGSQDIPRMTAGMLKLLVQPLFDEVSNLVKRQNPGAAEARFGAVSAALSVNLAYWESERSDKPHRSHAESFEVFIPIPKDRTVTAVSDGSVTHLEGDASPPSLIPIESSSSGSPSASVLPAMAVSGQVDEDSEDEGPPMLPFNAVHKG